MPLDDAWVALVDDAAIFPPGNAPLDRAVATYTARSAEDGAGLVGTLVVKDTDLPSLKGFGGALSVVVTGGAGQLTGPLELARRLGLWVKGLEIAVRDLDDPAGNAQRIFLAVEDAWQDGILLDEVCVYVELPHVARTAGWLAAADVVAASGRLRLKFRTGGLEAEAFPAAHALARWIDAALDRELPFKCTAGLHNAVRHTGEDGFEHHGFLNVLFATRRAFDGASLDEVVATLERRDAAVLASEMDSGMAGARRWFTSFGSCSVAEPLADLRSLGLVA